MRKTIVSKSIVVSGGNKGVSPGTPNIGGGKEMKNNVMLSDAEVKKGGKKMKRKVLQAVNKVKELKFYIKNFKTAMKNSEEDLEEYDFSKFHFNEQFDFFSREDVTMARAGAVCAAVFKNDDGYYYFFYDNKFMELSEGAKEFVYFHELGHVVLRHNDEMEDRKVRKEYRELMNKGEVPRIEYEADFFAAKRLGKWQALSALEEARAFLDPAFVEIINKRIKAIFLSDLD